MSTTPSEVVHLIEPGSGSSDLSAIPKKLLIRLFGLSGFAVRFPSVVAGVSCDNACMNDGKSSFFFDESNVGPFKCCLRALIMERQRRHSNPCFLYCSYYPPLFFLLRRLVTSVTHRKWRYTTLLELRPASCAPPPDALSTAGSMGQEQSSEKSPIT